jgi:2-methylcitrate dehydratase PrpD
MSFRFAICTALSKGRLDADSYSQPADAEVQRLIDITEIRIDEEFERRKFPAQPARVEIFLSGGEHQTSALPDVPWLEPQDVRRRFDREVGASLSNEHREQLHALITNLMDARDTSELFALLDGVR